MASPTTVPEADQAVTAKKGTPEWCSQVANLPEIQRYRKGTGHAVSFCLGYLSDAEVKAIVEDIQWNGVRPDWEDSARTQELRQRVADIGPFTSNHYTPKLKEFQARARIIALTMCAEDWANAQDSADAVAVCVPMPTYRKPTERASSGS